jgi:hypothetical protein
MTPGRFGAGVLILSVGLLMAPPETRGSSDARVGSLVVAQVPPVDVEAAAGDTLRGDLGEGGRLVVVDPAGEPRILTPDFHSATEPDVSFDGRRIVFAGRKTARDPWCIWEMGVEGGGAREITCGPGGARHPVYLPMMYTLTPTSTEPWEQVAFVGSLPGETNETGAGPRSALFTCRLDGTREHQITFNLSSDFDPVVLPDGRLVYASWQRRSLERGPEGRVALFGLNIDGTDLMLFSGDEGRRVKHMPAYAGDRLVAFVEGDRISGDGGGTLAAVSLRRNLHSHRVLSDDGLFRSPTTDPRGGLLVAWRPRDTEGTYGIQHFDPASGERMELFDDPDWHDVRAQRIGPRPVPDGRSSSVRGDAAVGSLYGLDVSISDLDRTMWPIRIARRLRLIEGLPRAEGASAGTGLATRRLLGEVDLAADGSFQVEVPADTPLELQLLDENGLALRSCAWIWTRWKEARGCIGCHEDPERTPPNRFVEAVQRPAARLLLPPERRRFVDFTHDIRPIVERRCLDCHGAEGASPRLDVPETYEALLEDAVRPGEARTSPLVWHLLGRRTDRPWDDVDPSAEATPMELEGGGATREEILTFIQWIDLGALHERPKTPDATSEPGGGQP